ncbi:MAG: alpha/beta hydrolase family protein [Cognaticolwellia sp.]
MYQIVKLIFVKLIAVVIVFSFSSLSRAENLIEHPNVQAQRDCFRKNFSDFATWRSSMANKYQRKFKNEQKVARALTRFDQSFNEKAFLNYQKTLTCQTFDYFVDGTKVRGFIIKPTATAQKLPVLVYNRGGNGNFGAVVFGSMMRNLFPIAAQGFVVIGSQYRGTFTRNKALDDEFGGKDVDDVLALLDFIPNINAADAEKVGMFGASRGGMQTYLALKQAKQAQPAQKIKAVAVIAGVSDLEIGLQQRPAMEKVYKKRIPNYENNKAAELEKRSVLKWLDELPDNVPMLLLHGTADKRVSVEQSKTLAAALDESGIPNKLELYPNDNHGLVANKAKATREIVAWFRKYL